MRLQKTIRYAPFEAIIYILLRAPILAYICAVFFAAAPYFPKSSQFCLHLSVFTVIFISALHSFASPVPFAPISIAAGFAFGWFSGILVSTAGIMLGQLLMLFTIRTCGEPARRLIFTDSLLRSAAAVRTSGNSLRILLILFFLPGTPKSLLSCCTAMMPADTKTYLFITVLSRLPSVIIMTAAGSALNTGSCSAAAMILAVYAVIGLTGLRIYRIVRGRDR